jgi:hypothetical protein
MAHDVQDEMNRLKCKNANLVKNINKGLMPQWHQKKKKKPVAHACNPSYSGVRRKMVQSQPPANSLRDPIWKIPNSKKD